MTSIYKRAAIPPGLPVSNPTTSYWQDPPDADIADLRSTEELPKQADVVIIGSGITGSCIALEYLERTKGAESVVVLEARQACSGATGRNGAQAYFPQVELPLTFLQEDIPRPPRIATSSITRENMARLKLSKSHASSTTL